MNIMKQASTLLLALGLVLGLGSCRKNSSDEVVESSFRVVSTEYKANAAASQGRIVTSEDGFSVSTTAPWVKAEKTGAVEVKLQISENMSFEARTASVVLTKGETTLNVPITQSGRVNQILGVKDQAVVKDGGSFAFSLAEVIDRGSLKVELAEADAAWVKHQIEGDQLQFVVDENTTGASRSAKVTISAGLFVKSFTITQGGFSMDNLAGTYMIRFKTDPTKPFVEGEVPVRLLDKDQKLFVIPGFAHLIPLVYDADKSTFTIVAAELPAPKGADASSKYSIRGFDGKGSVTDVNVALLEAKLDDSSGKPSFKFVPVDPKMSWIAFLVQTSDGKFALFPGVQGNQAPALTEISMTMK